MFEDKELLNTILYTKRFSTYLVCVIASLIGIGLCFVRVSDESVLKSYKEKYPKDIVWTDKINDKLSLKQENNNRYLINNSDIDIIGVLVNDEYYKTEVKKGEKVKVTYIGNITGCVINE